MTTFFDLPIVQLAEGISGRIQPGAGESVLWLHGYTLDGSMWYDMWPRLPGWQHVAVDLPGHGASGPVEDMVDLPTLGKRLGEMCVARGIRHIVALSFGTITATQMAIEFPSHFSSIVLSAPNLAGATNEPDIPIVYHRLLRYFHQFGKGPWMRHGWMKCRVWTGVEKVPEMREYLASLIDKHSWAEAKGTGMLRFTRPPHTPEALRRIEASVLVIIGDREMNAFKRVAETLRTNIPRCNVLELADGDHLAMIQHPEESARAIEAHLKANPAMQLSS